MPFLLIPPSDPPCVILSDPPISIPTLIQCVTLGGDCFSADTRNTGKQCWYIFTPRHERKKKELLHRVQARNRGRLLGPKSYCFLQREDVEYPIGPKMASRVR